MLRGAARAAARPTKPDLGGMRAPAREMQMMQIKKIVSLMLAVALLFACAHAQELSTGASGEEVERLQNRLYYLGFLSITPDGDYGPKTAEAVAAFQAFFNERGYSLRIDGVADERTQTLLYDDAVADANYPLTMGDKNGYVRRAQRRLIDLGFLSGAADGTYGQNTADAVRAFEVMLVDNGVAGVSVDGEADETTLEYLYSELLGMQIDTPVFYNEDNPSGLRTGHLYAEAAVLIDASTGETLLDKRASERMYPASTTKVMTLLLGLEYGDLEQTVTVPASAGQVPGDSSRMPVAVGEVLPYEDLLYGLMIRSGNDAANAIATLMAGSVDAFVERMNQKAQQLGLSGTHYDNPHGYHTETHYTTAADMAALTRYALQNEQFREVFETHTHQVAATNMRAARTLQCSYKIFDSASEFYYADAVGGKTGFTSAAGYCFVCTAQRGGVTLIAVVFHSGSRTTDRWLDAARMFEYGFALRGV